MSIRHLVRSSVVSFALVLASFSAQAAERFFTVQLAAGVTPDQLAQLNQKLGDSVPLTLVKHQGMLKVWSGRYASAKEAAPTLEKVRAIQPGVFIRQVSDDEVQSVVSTKANSATVTAVTRTETPVNTTPAESQPLTPSQAPAIENQTFVAQVKQPAMGLETPQPATQYKTENGETRVVITPERIADGHESLPASQVMVTQSIHNVKHPWLLQMEQYTQAQNWVSALPVAYAIEANPMIQPSAEDQRVMGWVYYHNGYYEAARDLFELSQSRQPGAETQAALAQVKAMLAEPAR